MIFVRNTGVPTYQRLYHSARFKITNNYCSADNKAQSSSGQQVKTPQQIATFSGSRHLLPPHSITALSLTAKYYLTREGTVSGTPTFRLSLQQVIGKMRIDDLLISLSYFSIPVQLAFALYNYNGMDGTRKIPFRLVILLVLFIFFILLCGCGHMLRALELHHTPAFDVLNWATCVVSVATALYLLPVAPSLLRDFDESMQALVTLNEETAASKRKLFTFMVRYLICVVRLILKNAHQKRTESG